jgi:uncharacterized membrane protein YeaQ/YmgE (transglycosylase-associated protein family)
VGIIASIVLGLVAGLIAEKLLGGREKHGVVSTMLIGVGGALLAGWAASTLLEHVLACQVPAVRGSCGSPTPMTYA